MSKKEIRHRETNLANSNGAMGKELEQTLTVDDSFLPSPVELAQYKSVDPKIVDLLCKMSESEQNYRHKTDITKLKIIGKSESRQYRINIWGMFFAFLALVLMMGVTALAIYLDKPWIATLFGVISVGSIVGLFISPKQQK
ncbi:MAG: DUF2335 domain-containing protein [Paramuribaculum sp.]|nr:DUF2335 domain-containing protein [Paramuribaculum sp.]